MMEVKEKTKIVEVAGQRWQLRRMSPVDGSYCWQRLMAAMFRSASAQPQMVVPADEAEELRMKEAIEKAISMAKTGDVVFVLGKGHEDYQILGDGKIPFSDREVVESALKRRSRVFLS